MSVFLNSLSTRERLLVMAAGVLAIILLIALGVVRPLLNYRDQSQQDLVVAQMQYSALTALAAEYRTANTDTQPARTADLNARSARIAISTSARDAGLVVSRIQPSEDGSLTLWMDTVSSAGFYGWLRALEAEQELSPDLVSLQKIGDGMLRVQVQFSGINS